MIHIIRNMTSKSEVMMRELRHLQKVLGQFDVRLQSKYIRSADNPADNLIQWCDRSDWKLNPKLFKAAINAWECRPTIYRFAMETNA